MREDSLTIEVKAKPGAKKNALAGFYGNRLKVEISAPPDKGRANKELVALIAKEFDITRSDVTIIKGEKSRNKTLRIAGDSGELKKRYDEIKKTFGPA